MKRNINAKRQKQALYESIMRQVAPEIRKALRESEEMNEGLFGIGDPSKPSEELTTEFIRTHSQDEIAELFHQYSIYIMAKANQNVDKAIAAFAEKTKAVWAGLSDSADGKKKALDAILTSVKASITGKYESAKKFAKAVPGHIIFSIAWLIKLSVNGWDKAEAALKSLYGSVASYLKEAYASIVEKIGEKKELIAEKYAQFKDTISLYMKVAGAAVIALANGLKGAAEAFEAWVKKIAADAKAKVLFAVSIVRSWFAVKQEAIKNWVTKTYADAKSAAIEAWNALEGKAVKAWNGAVEKVTDFINDCKATMEAIAQKIKDFAEETKNKAISLKDAGAAQIISKAVKALNKDNYPLDKVIDVVTKAYNESIYVDHNRLMLNEAKFNMRAVHYMRRLNG